MRRPVSVCVCRALYYRFHTFPETIDDDNDCISTSIYFYQISSWRSGQGSWWILIECNKIRISKVLRYVSLKYLSRPQVLATHQCTITHKYYIVFSFISPIVKKNIHNNISIWDYNDTLTGLQINAFVYRCNLYCIFIVLWNVYLKPI